MAALFVMDGEEIDRITQGIKPLTDFYPKRLSDSLPDLEGYSSFCLELHGCIRRCPQFPFVFVDEADLAATVKNLA